jgi:hypothetical protein
MLISNQPRRRKPSLILFSLDAKEDLSSYSRLGEMKTRRSEMKIFFMAAGIACFLPSVLAEEGTQKQESKAPIMVSFTDLKWVELPEPKGTQFAVLSGDPKTGPYTQMRKVPAGTDKRVAFS